MPVEFATAARVIVGPGVCDELGAVIRPFGTRVLLVTGKSTARAQGAAARLRSEGLAVTLCSIAGEPTVGDVQQAVLEARGVGAEVIVGLGGGSAVDAAKAIAALLPNEGDPLDYLEVVGQGLPLKRAAAPCIAVPTTAGTGAEVTRNAVLGVPDRRVKVSLRGLTLLPRVALVDPLLTHSVPPDVTVSTGFDALAQIIEPFVTHAATPITDGFCREALVRVRTALPAVCRDGRDADAREQMVWVSLFGGLSLANAKLGAVHGLAGPLGGMISAPHGALCAALLPQVMRVNVARLRALPDPGVVLQRFDEVARLLTGQSEARAEDGVSWVAELARTTGVQGLSRFGLSEQLFPEACEKASRASSMKGNPASLTKDELLDILSSAL